MACLGLVSWRFLLPQPSCAEKPELHLVPSSFLDALCVSDFCHGCLAIPQADWAHLRGLSLETTCIQWAQCPSQTGTQAREPHRVQSQSHWAILAQPVEATQGPFSTSLTFQAGTPLTCLTLPQYPLSSLQLHPLPGPGEPGEQRSLPESSGTLSVLSGRNARWQCAKEGSPSRPTLRGSAGPPPAGHRHSELCPLVIKPQAHPSSFSGKDDAGQWSPDIIDIIFPCKTV